MASGASGLVDFDGSPIDPREPSNHFGLRPSAGGSGGSFIPPLGVSSTSSGTGSGTASSAPPGASDFSGNPDSWNLDKLRQYCKAHKITGYSKTRNVVLDMVKKHMNGASGFGARTDFDDHLL